MPTKGGLKGCFKSQQGETNNNFRSGHGEIDWSDGKKPVKKKATPKKKKKEPVSNKNVKGLEKCKNKDCGSSNTELKPTVGGKIRIVCKVCKNRYDLST